MRPLLICVTGPDGSGKSTACARARELLTAGLGAGAVAEVSIWDSLREQDGVAPALRTHEEAARYLGDLDGVSRTLFLFHAMSRAMQLGLRREGARVLLVNGYWYKYAVSELGYGVPAPAVLGAARGFATPDEVILLEIEPGTAWERRRRASAYEQGPEAGSDAGARFVAFQRGLAREWKRVEAESGLPWRRLNSSLPPEEVASRIARHALDRLAGNGAP